MFDSTFYFWRNVLMAGVDWVAHSVLCTVQGERARERGQSVTTYMKICFSSR